MSEAAALTHSKFHFPPYSTISSLTHSLTRLLLVQDGWTLAHIAARYAGVDMLECLSARGADMDARDNVRELLYLYLYLYLY